MKVVGLDLAGLVKNGTGFCLLLTPGKGSPLGKTETKVLHTDMEIIGEIEVLRPDCIAIDAPFWLPKVGAWRPSEQELMKRGFEPLSPMLPSMKVLSLRASHLVRILRERGFNVIEVFSKASEKVLGLSKEPRRNKDEYDALLCALTAKAYLNDKYIDIGGVILPR